MRLTLSLLLFALAIIQTSGFDAGTFDDLPDDLRENFKDLTLGKGLREQVECDEVQMSNITFYLYTQENPKETVLKEANLNQVPSDKKLVFLIHGWVAFKSAYGMQEVKDAFIKYTNHTVIIVDWRKFSFELYSTSVCKLPKIAKQVVQLLMLIEKERGIKPTDVHVVGHSLGGQMSGLIGQHYFNQTGIKLDRLTGLDPAGPLFVDEPRYKRIDSTDAVFVDIIHTNGGGMGYLGNCGTADFYMNCGSVQPNCYIPNLLNKKDRSLVDLGSLAAFSFDADTLDDLPEDLRENFKDLTLGKGLREQVHCDEVQMSNITFYLYTQENPEETILKETNLILVPSDKKLVFLIHGWICFKSSYGMQEVKDAFIKYTNYTVIIVDWRKFSFDLYSSSVCKLPKIAKQVAQLIMLIGKERGIKPTDVHVIGHSLGGQMSGLIGQHYFNQTGVKLDRLTGLDPAGPLFVDEPRYKRIDSTDAVFVDIIHTNGGGLGYFGNCGTADFYINCGSVQPNCYIPDLLNKRNRSLTDLGYLSAFSFDADTFDDLPEDLRENFKDLTLGKGLREQVHCDEVQMSDITFYLYTQENPEETILKETNLILVPSDKKLVFLIHGWVSYKSSWGMQVVKDAFIKYTNHTVVIVDWRKFSLKLYSTAVCKLPKIAKQVVQFLMLIENDRAIKPTDVHVIGHSLGGQMSGLIGQHYLNQTGVKLDRLTGLDPAGPLFVDEPRYKRIDSTDAVFVDIIHTNGGGLGYFGNCGTADFYMNCGFVQPNCYIPNLLNKKNRSLADLASLAVACSHLRAFDYFAESIKTKIEASPCRWCPLGCPPVLSFFKKKIVMGENCNRNANSGYYASHFF
ncbi:hypothetical protein FQA39_LY12594 [Lamprigera yunnana]|nr:hypothetical protein FQA39_LY12594 [Lamprigera yunnana]